MAVAVNDFGAAGENLGVVREVARQLVHRVSRGDDDADGKRRWIRSHEQWSFVRQKVGGWARQGFRCKERSRAGTNADEAEEKMRAFWISSGSFYARTSMNILKRLYLSLPVIHQIDRVTRKFECAKEAMLAEFGNQNAMLRTERFERLRTEKVEKEGPRSLHGFEHQVCSQNGEDGVIAEIYRRIGHGNRVFAEVGVGDGVENNTAFLHSLGWTGFWFDGEPPRFGVPSAESGLRFQQAFVDRENIAALFSSAGVPRDLDLLSLDIDQNTYFAWQGLRDWKARVIVVEYNASIPASIEWCCNYDPKRTWDGSVNFGASLKAFEKLGRESGYTLVHAEILGANAFFVRDDLVAGHFDGPFDAETHYEPPRYELLHRTGHRSARLDRA